MNNVLYALEARRPCRRHHPKAKREIQHRCVSNPLQPAEPRIVFKPSLIPECDYTVVANSWIVQINSQTLH